jgi:SAM-dependent methyltransferase
MMENEIGPDPGSDALCRVRTLLGDEAAAQFAPLFQEWISNGFIGASKFKATGDNIVSACRELGGLQPTHRVLDVGCGIGRITLPLLEYLSPPGSYEGFDIIASAITWLSRYVTAQFPAFRFRLAGHVRSELYNPQGAGDPANFVFPYDQNSFDFAVAVSVFAHMTPPGISRYLAETARILKAGSRFLCTAYLLDDEGLRAATAGSPGLSFPHEFRFYRLRNLAVPESAVAVDEPYFLEMAGAVGLNLAHTIRRGAWRQGGYNTGQDIVALEKRV